MDAFRKREEGRIKLQLAKAEDNFEGIFYEKEPKDLFVVVCKGCLTYTRNTK